MTAGCPLEPPADTAPRERAPGLPTAPAEIVRSADGLMTSPPAADAEGVVDGAAKTGGAITAQTSETAETERDFALI
jgi:hypothetical protein